MRILKAMACAEEYRNISSHVCLFTKRQVLSKDFQATSRIAIAKFYEVAIAISAHRFAVANIVLTL